MSIEIICPHCSAEFSIREGRTDADWYELNDLVMTLPDICIRPLWRYLELFKGTHRLKSSKLLAITKQLHPMIKAGQITRNKVTHVVTPKLFALTMSQLADNPPESLTLPLKTHGYLLSMLVTQANKAVSAVEVQQERQAVVRTGEYQPGFKDHAQILAELSQIKERQNRPNIELTPEHNSSKSIQQEK